MKQIKKVLFGVAPLLILSVPMALAQNNSVYTGRTINIQPLVPAAQTTIPTNTPARAINASQTLTTTYDAQLQFKVNELEARIAQLEQLNADAQNRIAALESSHNAMATQLNNLQNSGGSTSTGQTPGSSYLQVGAFSRLDLAGQLVFKLQQLGYQVYDSNSNGVTKLFIGPYDNSRIPEEQYRLSLQNIVDSFPVAVP